MKNSCQTRVNGTNSLFTLTYESQAWRRQDLPHCQASHSFTTNSRKRALSPHVAYVQYEWTGPRWPPCPPLPADRGARSPRGPPVVGPPAGHRFQFSHLACTTRWNFFFCCVFSPPSNEIRTGFGAPRFLSRCFILCGLMGCILRVKCAVWEKHSLRYIPS